MLAPLSSYHHHRHHSKVTPGPNCLVSMEIFFSLRLRFSLFFLPRRLIILDILFLGAGLVTSE
jgi:hypothetical protein